MQVTVRYSDARVPGVVANLLRAEEFSQIGQFCVAKIVGRDVLIDAFEQSVERLDHCSIIMWIQQCTERAFSLVFSHDGHGFGRHKAFSQHACTLLFPGVPGDVGPSFRELYERFKSQLNKVLRARSKFIE